MIELQRGVYIVVAVSKNLWVSCENLLHDYVDNDTNYNKYSITVIISTPPCQACSRHLNKGLADNNSRFLLSLIFSEVYNCQGCI